VSKYSLALDTAADRPILIERVMPKLGIDPALFVEIITADELVNQAHAKPDPHTPRLLMKSHGFKPSETVMVGDSENDVLAAYHSGIEPIVVLTGNLDRRAAEALEVDYIIEDVTHLESALRELGRTGIRPSFAYQA
jgi:phosphoglycolate phosphatase-like HAD superfamily hydrolase